MATVTTCDICETDTTAGDWISLVSLLSMEKEFDLTIYEFAKEYEHLCDRCAHEIRKKAVGYAIILKAGIEDGTYTTRAGCGWMKKE